MTLTDLGDLPAVLSKFTPSGLPGDYGAIAGGAEGPPLPKQPRRRKPSPGAFTSRQKLPRHRAKDPLTALSPEPRTGTQHHIAAGDYRATVTELGAALRQLSYRGQPVSSGYPADD